MTRFITLATALALAACAHGGPTVYESDIPGVAAAETSFFSGSVHNVLRGDNDVIFVSAAGRWYRTQLNDGCLERVASNNPTFIFQSQGTSKVDRFTKVHVVDGGGMPLQCKITSIRESLAPPMVDSQSIVPRG